MNKNFIFHSDTNVGLVRKANEDAYGDELTPNGHVFVVCDGMGGHVGGAKASGLAVVGILEFFQNHLSANPSQLIADAIKFANTQVHGYASTFPEFKGMGTTCVVLLVAPDGKIYYGHVGDSRIYMYSKGILSRLTKDHSYVQFLVDTGEISESEMETHPNKNQILKALGIDESVKPEICPAPLDAVSGTIFLLCSDGLSGMVADSLMKEHLDRFAQNKAGRTVELLIENALQNGGNDNITATLICIDDDDNSSPTLMIRSNATKTANSGIFKKVLLLVFFLVVAGSVFLFALNLNNKKLNSKNTEDSKHETSKENVVDPKKKDDLKLDSTEAKSNNAINSDEPKKTEKKDSFRTSDAKLQTKKNKYESR